MNISIDLRKKIESLLRQDRTEFTPFEDAVKVLINAAGQALQLKRETSSQHKQ